MHLDQTQLSATLTFPIPFSSIAEEGGGSAATAVAVG